jgi:glycosyltransferase involved in cell wall biosynthesis
MSLFSKMYPSQVRRFFRMKVKLTHFKINENYDYIQAMDVFSLEAGVALKKKINKPLIVDINELPNLKGRPAAENLKPFFKRLLNQKIKSVANEPDEYITTCKSLADFTDSFLGRKPLVVKNFNPAWDVNNQNKLRTELKLPDDAFCLIFPATAAPKYGVEQTIKALSLLPDNIKLIFVGRFNSQGYEIAIKKFIETENLTDRVFFKGPFYGDEYFEYLSGGDIAISPLSMKVENHQHILPSRLLDMITAEMPIISTNISEFFNLNCEIDAGFGMDHLHEIQIAKAVNNYRALDENVKQHLKANIRKLKAAYSKAAEQERYVEIVRGVVKGDIKKVAFVCNLGIVNNKRLITFCETLENLGASIDVFCIAPVREELRKNLKSTTFIPLYETTDISLDLKCYFAYAFAAISRIYTNDVQGLFKKLQTSIYGLYRKLKPKSYFYSKNQLHITQQFAEKFRTTDDFEPDVILLHDTLASKAGIELHKQHKHAQLVMDVTEIPDLKQRISVELRCLSDEANQQFVEWEKAFIQNTQLIFTLNKSFKNFISERYQRDDVEVVKNVRSVISTQRKPIQFLLNISPEDIVVVFTGFASQATCALPLIKAFEQLPPNVHLLFLSAATNNAFKNKMVETAKKLSLNDRIHFHAPIYGEHYLEVLSSCDIGLVLFETNILQTKLVLPNRYLDFVAAGLPVLSTNVDDVKDFISYYNTGESIKEIKPDQIARGIMKIINRYEIKGNGVISDDFKECSLRLQKKICMENDFEQFSKKIRELVKDVEKPKVAFLARQRLSSNTRIARQCIGLLNEGCEVKLYGINEGPSDTLLKQMGNIHVEVFDIA